MLKALYQPVKPFRINQRFGENTVCVSTDGNRQILSCNGNNPPAGYKSLYGKAGHKGIDLAAKHGQEVYCAQRGMIYQIDTNPKSGLDVRIISVVGGVQIRHIYEHLLGYEGKIGQIIETGQLIGWADNTGYSSGDHLHFQVEVLENGAWKAVDPETLLYEGIFARDILVINHKILAIAEFVARLLDRTGSKLRQLGRA